MTQRLFTSESVTEGHPDKICDAISDSILDAMLAVDPDSHVAVETVVTTGQVHVVGEVRCRGYVEIPSLVRQTLRDIGFLSSDMGFDGATCGVSVSIGEQSLEIGAGVDTALEARDGAEVDDDDRAGAGDQGLMFGYATNETPEYMPLPKTQVTLAYDDDNNPIRIDTIVISTQHDPGVSRQWLEEQLRTNVITPVIKDAGVENLVDDELTVLINPSGSFVVGGPMGDAGLTGRKIIVDTYGGMARHGGGAFSGKDPSKVDRSAAYAMRWVAKNIVAAGLADRCEVQVAYAIGRANPVGLYVETFGTEKEPISAVQEAVQKVFDLRPAAIIRELDLKRPIYAQTAAYGHFGRTDVDLPWERLDRVDDLKAAISR
ncbi:MAG: methionine adenosyltransferase [Corynebacterium kroppenstedtii]|nr:methionine adenosyltransferase [Corynebacterium kroppenstedtii]